MLAGMRALTGATRAGPGTMQKPERKCMRMLGPCSGNLVSVSRSRRTRWAVEAQEHDAHSQGHSLFTMICSAELSTLPVKPSELRAPDQKTATAEPTISCGMHGHEPTATPELHLNRSS